LSLKDNNEGGRIKMHRTGKILIALFLGLTFGFGAWLPTANTKTPTAPVAKVLTSNLFETILDINLSGFELNNEIENGISYAVLSLPGEAGTTSDIGFPQLPKISRSFGIPDRAQVTVSVIESEYKTFENILLYPFQTPTTDEDKQPPFVINQNAYQQDQFSPVSNVAIANQSQWRQLYLANVEIVPFAYNPKLKELRVYNHLKVKISYSGGAWERKTIEPWLARIYKKSIANYDDLYASDLFDVRYNDNPGVRYLILSHPNFTATIDSLASWYNKRGIETKIISKVWATANEMKDSIKAEYNRNDPPVLKWALLIGDVDRMPTGTWGTTTISDFWFGNLTPTTPDLYAEVGIGRLSCTDAADLANQVRKILKYSKNPPMDGWLDKSVLIAHKELYPSKYSACKRGIYNYNFPYYRYTMDTIMGQFLGNTAVAAAINEGRNVVNYRGHGDVQIWWQWGTPAEDWSNSNVNALNNGDKTPVVFNMCCLNHVITDPTCLGEAWLRKYPGGAVASLGASIASYTIPNHGFDSLLYRGLCDTVDWVIPSVRTYYAPVWDLGWLLNLANAYVALYHSGTGGPDNARAYFWLGDPAMEVWTGTPQTPDVTYPPSVPIGPYDLNITVTASGAPIEGTLVCAQKGSEFHVFGYTDASGQVTLSIDAASVGDFDITVSGHTILPFEGTGLVRVSGQPYVTHLRHIIDDATGGNGDGIVNPGETINMPVWVKNNGDSTGHGITGYLSINDANVTLNDSVKSFGDVLAHDSAYSGNTGYNFSVSAACTNGYALRFNLGCADTYDSIWNSNIFLVVGAPVINFVDKTIDDAGQARPNGKLDPGETGQLIVSLHNQGRGNAYNVSAILRSGDSRLTVDDSVGNFGPILVDSSGNNDGDRFILTASALIPNETNIACTLYITANSGYTRVTTFTIGVGVITAIDPIPDGPREPPLYYAYDNVDTFYFEHPTYDWVEINTIGTRLTMTDDQTYTITLPSTFGPWKFYNQRYTQLSICSNGWVAPGSQTSTAYNNQHLPDPLGIDPNGMICANWDDMLPSNTGVGGVYHYHDVANHRFIIEYDSTPYWNSSVMDKYEIIIYDTTMAAADGSNEIVVQYMTTSRWNSSTVGIEDPTNQIAICALSNDTLHRGCSPWAPGKVIKYTSDPPTPQGIVQEPTNIIKTDIVTSLRTYPNPFHNTMRIQFSLNHDGPVALSIHDVSGRQVKSIVSGNFTKGTYSLNWDGKNENGKKVANGIYFYRLKTDNEKIITKSILLR
jgi:hypothetical protein